MTVRQGVRVACLLTAAALAGVGCSDPLIQVKDTFAEGAASASFDTVRLEEMQEAASQVMGRKDRYGDEGVAQAGLMLAYGYVCARRFDQAARVVQQLSLLVNVTELSPESRMMLTAIKADTAYEKALRLAMDDVHENREEMARLVNAAVDAYDQARTSDVYEERPKLQQLFALREADILISAGNLWRLWDVAQADHFYSRAVEVATEASKLDAALGVELMERALDAHKRLGNEIPPGEESEATPTSP